MTKQLNVYGIGNAIMDMQVQAEDSVLEKLGLEKAGMQLVSIEEQKALIEELKGSEFAMSSGGSNANAVIAVAQLGGRAAYGCLVGNDEFGRHYQREMNEFGIELSNKPVDNEVTGTSLIIITPDAERTMNTNLGVSAGFGPENLSEDHIAQAEWIFIEGYLLASDSGAAAAIKAAELAKSNDTKVAITFSDGFIVDVFSEPLKAVIRHTDLAFANTLETKAFTKKEEEDEAFEALRSVAPCVAMTMHERGAKVSFGGEVFHTPSFAVDAIDSTGAGDMYAGAFLYGITNGFSAEESSRLACFFASRVVSQMGARLHGDLRHMLASDELGVSAPL